MVISQQGTISTLTYKHKFHYTVNRQTGENLNVLQNYTDNNCARPFYESLTYSDDNMTNDFLNLKTRPLPSVARDKPNFLSPARARDPP